MTEQKISVSVFFAELSSLLAAHRRRGSPAIRVDEVDRLIEAATDRALGQMALRVPLYCPNCGVRHVDRDEWDTRLHHIHLCGSCAFKWRVEPYCIGIDAEEQERKRRESPG